MVIGWDGVIVNGYMQIWRGLVVREYGRDAVSGKGGMGRGGEILE